MASIPNLPKISLSRNQIIMIVGGIVLIATTLLLFRFFGSKAPSGPPIYLTVWGMDSEDAVQGIISGYSTLRPNVTVEYISISPADYDENILRALASGRGPDVFFIGNHDLLSRGDLLSPAPPGQVSLNEVQAGFPQAVAQDFVHSGQVYALPLYMDTLALLYNRQMFDQAGIANPPGTWEEVLALIPALRILDANGQIQRAALAIGGSERSVAHATDILNLLMLQNGAAISDDAGRASFSSGNGANAFHFYLQFADAANPVYTWNDFVGNSLESFASQKTAMVLGYKSDFEELKKQSPFLDFGVAAAPQISADRAVNYPSYRGLGVWVGSQVPEWAWDFILFAATDSYAQSQYLAFTGRPAALRTLIPEQQKNPQLAVFAKASLTARSWKMGDYAKIRNIFTSAIQNVQNGAKTPTAALQDAETQANQLIRR